MAREVIISTSGVNSYGTRVLTSGIDLSQFLKNPVLLWMHRRSWEKDAMPIGRIDNLRIDGDKLIGTPVFDQTDEFAKKIENKWENGFLRMASAGIEIVETSEAPEHLLPGQRRHTITKCRLEEVSIVDIGANDDALQLYETGGKVLKLAAGEDCPVLPLLSQDRPEAGAEGKDKETNQLSKQMDKELLKELGLPEGATETQAVEAIRLMKQEAAQAESMRLASITALVDGAIADKRITADKKEHFINLGKTAGVECLKETLALMKPTSKPTDMIQRQDAPAGSGVATFAKLSEVPADQLEKMRSENPQEYVRLYKAEYGFEPKI